MIKDSLIQCDLIEQSFSALDKNEFQSRVIKFRPISSECEEINAILLDNCNNGLTMLSNIDLPAKTIILLKLENNYLAIGEVIKSENVFDSEHNLTRINVIFIYREEWPTSQLPPQEQRLFAESLVYDHKIRPCSALGKRCIVCEKISEEPPSEEW